MQMHVTVTSSDTPCAASTTTVADPQDGSDAGRVWLRAAVAVLVATECYRDAWLALDVAAMLRWQRNRMRYERELVRADAAYQRASRNGKGGKA